LDLHPGLPIGLVDSGLGGLTVLRQLRRCIPDESLVYLADSARSPYGERSPGEIRAIAAETAQWLRGRRVKAMVMACNTMNALAADVIRTEAGVPVVSLIDAVVANLPLNSGDRVVVLATAATVASGAYGRAIRHGHPGVQVQEIACPDLVPAIEAGEWNSARLEQVIINYLNPIFQIPYPVQAVVLGCTHYPLISPLLQQLLPWPVPLLDPARSAAMALHQLLQTTGLATCKPKDTVKGTVEFYCTGQTARFATSASHWIGQPVQVEQATLQPALLGH